MMIIFLTKDNLIQMYPLTLVPNRIYPIPKICNGDLRIVTPLYSVYFSTYRGDILKCFPTCEVLREYSVATMLNKHGKKGCQTQSNNVVAQLSPAYLKHEWQDPVVYARLEMGDEGAHYKFKGDMSEEFPFGHSVGGHVSNEWMMSCVRGKVSDCECEFTGTFRLPKTPAREGSFLCRLAIYCVVQGVVTRKDVSLCFLVLNSRRLQYLIKNNIDDVTVIRNDYDKEFPRFETYKQWNQDGEKEVEEVVQVREREEGKRVVKRSKFTAQYTQSVSVDSPNDDELGSEYDDGIEEDSLCEMGEGEEDEQLKTTEATKFHARSSFIEKKLYSSPSTPLPPVLLARQDTYGSEITTQTHGEKSLYTHLDEEGLYEDAALAKPLSTQNTPMNEPPVASRHVSPLHGDLEDQPFTRPVRQQYLPLFVLWLPPFGWLGMHHYQLRRFQYQILCMFTLNFFLIGWVYDVTRLTGLIDSNLVEIQRHLVGDPREKFHPYYTSDELWTIWLVFGL